MTQLESTTSTAFAGERDRLDVALEPVDVGRRRPWPGWRGRGRASRRSCRGRRRCRWARRGGRRAGRRCRRRSRGRARVSPSFSSATAVGLPQPSEASSGSFGQLLAVAVGRTGRGRTGRLARRSSRPSRRCSTQPPRVGGGGERCGGVALADGFAEGVGVRAWPAAQPQVPPAALVSQQAAFALGSQQVSVPRWSSSSRSSGRA